jgi:two-component system, sensor histidine kinase and response regulator
MSMIFENAAILLMLVDSEGRVVNINKTGLEITGWEKGNVLGHLGGEVFNCLNAWHNGQVVCRKGRNCSQCSVRNLVNDTFSNGRNHYKTEGSLDIRNGDQIIRLDLLISTSKIKANEEEFVLITIDDVTKLKTQEKDLLQLNADKDLFMSILAHDLRDPFNTLFGFSDLLLRNIRKYGIEKIEKHVRLINQTALVTFDLLEDLLLWSKSQSGKLPFNPQKIILKHIYDDLILNLQIRAKSKNISINFHEDEKLVIYADINMLRTILRNMISNAIKFTGKNGTINIFAEKDIKDVIITVLDNGLGMDKEKQNRLWRISQQNTSEGTEGEKGTGFGLILCKEFVEKHGGKIWVKSEPGKGSEFKFSLPLYYN